MSIFMFYSILQILSPLLVGVSTAAEETVANLHADNFGRGAEDADMGSMLTIEDCISVRGYENYLAVAIRFLGGSAF